MIKNILKFGLAAGIIYWMINSGKLDFSLVKKTFSSGHNAYIGVFLIFCQATICSIRWKLLLDTKAKKAISKFSTACLTWIGLFFNTVLPGAVTGDLIKLVYARDLDKSLTKSFLFSTVFLDRILGLMGLLFLMGIFTLMNFSEMFALSAGMKSIITFNMLLFLGAVIFILLLFLPKHVQDKFLALFTKIPLLGPKIAKVMGDIWHIGSNKKTTLFCVLLSIFTQFINVFAFWLLTKSFYGVDLSLTQVFTFIPVGLISVAIPISPMGAGVGHLVFNQLFSYVGVQGGASLFNIYFVAVVGVNLLGVLPYIFFGKHHNLRETEQFDQESNA